MTRYCIQFDGERWKVRAQLWALAGACVTDYDRACTIAQYLNARTARGSLGSTKLAA